jgi:hypothetical protein
VTDRQFWTEIRRALLIAGALIRVPGARPLDGPPTKPTREKGGRCHPGAAAGVMLLTR